MGRPLFVGSHFIYRSRVGLSVSKKDKKMHGMIMVLICVCFGDLLPKKTLCDPYHKEFKSH